MALKLVMTPLSGGERQERTLSKGSLSIGRGTGNDWVLADPDQHLSRTHCMLSHEQGQYWIADLSTNGMLINGSSTPTRRDSRTVLTDGDSIVLGRYRLDITEIEDRAAPARDPFAAAGRFGENDPLAADPLADPLYDPLADPFAEAPAGQAGRMAGFHHPTPYVAPVARAIDPFDSADRGRPSDPGQDLFQGDTPADPWQGPAQRDDAAAVSHAFSAPKPIQPASIDDIDFDELLGDLMPQQAPARPPPAASPRPAPTAAPVADPFDALLDDPPASPPPPPAPAAVPPPTPAVAERPLAAPAAQPAAAQPTPALLAAFFEGAGIAVANIPPEEQEAAMRALGALFRGFVSGTRDVLMSRAEIKGEMRVERTMIRSRDNNALKFSVTPEEALMALLQPNRPGYKAPLAAVEEAFDDIRSHELAVMAGMQTGLLALLKRFDPAALEGRLQKGMLDGILPSARKARFWELFCATYKDIAREAEDDFHALFGREFARAYTAQINKL
jgi:type VI secretion system FHA domain protein